MSPRTLSNRKKPAGHSPPDKKATLADELAVWVKCNSRQGSRLARAGPARGANQPRTQENLSLLCQLSENAREDRHPSGLGPTVHPLLRCVSSTSPAGKRARPDPSGPLSCPGRRSAARPGRSPSGCPTATVCCCTTTCRPAGGRASPIAVLVHGLGGTHASPPVLRLSWRLLARRSAEWCGSTCAAGPGLPLARGFYHGGRSDDVRAALDEVYRWSPSIAPAGPAGVSLGGTIVLKMAGEAGNNQVPGLARVAVIGPPIDLARFGALSPQPEQPPLRAAVRPRGDRRGLQAAA